MDIASSVGYWWSAVPINTAGGYSLGFSSTAVNPLYGYYRSGGLPVRSVME